MQIGVMGILRIGHPGKWYIKVHVLPSNAVVLQTSSPLAKLKRYICIEITTALVNFGSLSFCGLFFFLT
jgi:hypothetical protein